MPSCSDASRDPRREKEKKDVIKQFYGVFIGTLH